MALNPGTRLGAYEVAELIGAGGMGEVYRARDTRLERLVAIKVLPEEVAGDRERLARFKREAQLLASLNHPNIAAIYGLEEADGLRYLVLEYVPGQTLAEMVGAVAAATAPTPLPVEEALEICMQIAEALEAAHEKAIIHRDLKPANVKVTPEGKVKVLDFGLAKAMEPEGSAADLSKSPTISAVASRAGVILGTAAYMSPEQARGKPVDKRTDIWAFGCVLYEMLTGKAAFGADTITDTIAAIVKSEPDWSALPAETPAPLRTLLRRCLQKDPGQRVRDIGDARVEIAEALAEPAVAPPPGVGPAALQQPWRRSALWIWACLGLLVGSWGTGLAVWRLKPVPQAPPQPVRRVAVPVSPTELYLSVQGPAVALSPDGGYLAYVGVRGGVRQLYLRSLDRLEAQPLAGTEDALGPFFSPDGEWLGFFAGGKLKKVPVSGGSPLTLCDAPNARGASWAPDNTIIFAPGLVGALFRVPAAGGKPESLTTLKKEDRAHRWPEVLPGGKAVLFTIGSGVGTEGRIAVQRLDSGERRELLQGGSNARYAHSGPGSTGTGHLVYVGPAGLLAVPFNLSRLELAATPFPVVENVASEPSGAGHFSLIREGSLAYVIGRAGGAERAVVWVNRNGTIAPFVEPRRAYSAPQLSQDGQRLAVELLDNPHNVWMYDLPRRVLTRLTFEGGNHTPVLTPDGKRVIFTADKAQRNLLWKAADGSGPEERLTNSPNSQFPTSCSPDGKLLAFDEIGPTSRYDIWVLPLEGERKPRPFLATCSTNAAGSSRPTAAGWPISPTSPGRTRCTCSPSPVPA